MEKLKRRIEVSRANIQEDRELLQTYGRYI